jgi:hypothetical protein
MRGAPDYADAMFNLALLLHRSNNHAEAAEYGGVLSPMTSI